jgi:hypothetical protein
MFADLSFGCPNFKDPVSKTPIVAAAVLHATTLSAFSTKTKQGTATENNRASLHTSELPLFFC